MNVLVSSYHVANVASCAVVEHCVRYDNKLRYVHSCSNQCYSIAPIPSPINEESDHEDQKIDENSQRLDRHIAFNRIQRGGSSNAKKRVHFTKDDAVRLDDEFISVSVHTYENKPHSNNENENVLDPSLQLDLNEIVDDPDLFGVLYYAIRYLMKNYKRGSCNETLYHKKLFESCQTIAHSNVRGIERFIVPDIKLHRGKYVKRMMEYQKALLKERNPHKDMTELMREESCKLSRLSKQMAIRFAQADRLHVLETYY